MGDASISAALQQLFHHLSVASPEVTGSGHSPGERAGALSSLVLLLQQPQGTLLVRKSGGRLFSTLQRLTSDKNPEVSHAAAVAYGAAGAAAARGQPSHGHSAGAPPPGLERMLSWSLAQLKKVTGGGGGGGSDDLSSSSSSSCSQALVALASFVASGRGAVGLERHLPSVMQACQALLEDEGTPMGLLPPLLAALSALAQHYPRALQPSFEDVVDLLLGWALEEAALPPPTAASHCRQIARFFVHVRSLWAASSAFAHTLLLKLLEDMEALAAPTPPEDPSGAMGTGVGAGAGAGVSPPSSSSSSSPAQQQQQQQQQQEKLDRLEALAMCFLALLEGSMPGPLGASSPPEVVCEARALLARFQTCAASVVEATWSPSWAAQGLARGLQVFAAVLGPLFADHREQALGQMGRCLATTCASAEHTCSILTSLMQILRSLEGGSPAPPGSIRRLLTSTLVPWIRLHPCQVAAMRAAALYAYLLEHPHAPTAAEAADSLQRETECLCRALCRLRGLQVGGGSAARAEGQQEGGENDAQRSPSPTLQEAAERGELLEAELESVLHFNIQALALALALPKASSRSDSSKEERQPIPAGRGKDGGEGVKGVAGRNAALVSWLLTSVAGMLDPCLSWYPRLQLSLLQAVRQLTMNSLSCLRDNDKPTGSYHRSSREAPSPSLARAAAAAAVARSVSFASLLLQGALGRGASAAVKVAALEWLAALSSPGLVAATSSASVGDTAADAAATAEGESEGAGTDAYSVQLEDDIIKKLLGATEDPDEAVRDAALLTWQALLESQEAGKEAAASAAQAPLLRLLPLHEYALAARLIAHLADRDGPTPRQRTLLALCAPAALWYHGWLPWSAQSADGEGGAWGGRGGATGRLTADMVLAGARQGRGASWGGGDGSGSGEEGVALALSLPQLAMVVNFLCQKPMLYPASWLQRLTHSLTSGTLRQELGQGQGQGLVDHDGDGAGALGWSEAALALWAVQVAAQQLIPQRLRTHLGGPSATFAALEKHLGEVSRPCSPPLLLLLLDSGGELEGERLGAGKGKASLLPMRLLLEFVDALERAVFSASRGGCAAQLAGPQSSSSSSSSSLLFFRANRRVCEDWFARVREPLLHACVALEDHEGAVRHAGVRLAELRQVASAAARAAAAASHSPSPPASSRDRSGGSGGIPSLRTKPRAWKDALHWLRHMALSLRHLGDSDALEGLRLWAASSFASWLSEEGVNREEASSLWGPLGWLRVLSLQAAGQHEQAAAHVAHMLSSHAHVLDAETSQFCIARALESYAAMSDWEAMDSWLQEVQVLRTKQSAHAGSKGVAVAAAAAAAAAVEGAGIGGGSSFGVGVDMSAIQALACFDAHDFSGAQQALDRTPQSAPSSLLLTADPRQALVRSELLALRAMLCMRQLAPQEALESLQSARALLEVPLQLAALASCHQSLPLLLHCGGLDALERAAESMLAAPQNSSSSRAASAVGKEILEGARGTGATSVAATSGLRRAMQYPLDVAHQSSEPWLKLARAWRVVAPSAHDTSRLHAQLSCLARKQGNYRAARRLLLQSGDGDGDDVDGYGHGYGSERLLRSGAGDAAYMKLQLDYAEGARQDALVQLWQRNRQYLVEGATPLLPAAATTAQECLKLAKWARRSPQDCSIVAAAAVAAAAVAADAVSPGLGASSPLPADNGDEDEDEDEAARCALYLPGAAAWAAACVCPPSAKAWFTFGTWCRQLGSAAARTSEEGEWEDRVAGEGGGGSGSGKRGSGALLQGLPADIGMSLSASLSAAERAQLSDSVLDVIQGAQELPGGVHALIARCAELIEGAAAADLAADKAPGGDASGRDLHRQVQVETGQQAAEEGGVPLSAAEAQQVADAALAVWRRLVRRRLGPLALAARSLCQFLSIAHVQQQQQQQGVLGKCGRSGAQSGAGAGAGGGGTAGVKGAREDMPMHAMLQLLDLLARCGPAMEEELQACIAAVPPLPWQAVIPQLVAHMAAHEEPAVRRLVGTLVAALAKAAPWTLVYHAVAEKAAAARSDHASHLMAHIGEQQGTLVSDTWQLAQQLSGMATLWEEQWLALLQDLHPQVMRALSALRLHATSSTPTPAEQLAARYSSVMAPFVALLEGQLAVTAQPAGTPYQLWFQSRLQGPLKEAVAQLRTPPVHAGEVAGRGRVLERAAVLLSAHQKRKLRVGDVAPRLPSLDLSAAPMPGLEATLLPHLGFSSPMADSEPAAPGSRTGSGAGTGAGVAEAAWGAAGLVTIAGVEEEAEVLSTKTRPKRVALLGSDGRAYAYLLKGREDLRLDARVMQVLRCANRALRAHAPARARQLAAAHYSVTPLSRRAGLIQWVGGLTSLYSLYKAWQQHALLPLAPPPPQAAGSASPNPALPAHNQKKGEAAGAVDAAAAGAVRPVDAFYARMHAALKARGLSRSTPRREWPADLKRGVLLELMRAVPAHLVAHALWCASPGPAAWYRLQNRFSGSVATMSMLGYVLGLGDRHLDNILVDVRAGEVLHIDYNVSFEKGRHLKVPELVPFRLTHTLRAALGLTGVEGRFRASCEAAMAALRRSRASLSMLLSAFVLQPLLDWGEGAGAGAGEALPPQAPHKNPEQQQQQVQALSLSSLAPLAADLHAPVQAECEELQTVAAATASSLQELVGAADQSANTSAARVHGEQRAAAASLDAQHKQEELRSTQAALSSAQVALRRAPSASLEQAHALVVRAANEALECAQQYRACLLALQSGSLPPSLLQQQQQGQEGEAPTSPLLMGALAAAAVPLAVVPPATQAQCRAADAEQAALARTRSAATTRAVAALQLYVHALQSLLPSNYLATFPPLQWAQLLQAAAVQPEARVVGAARHEAEKLLLILRGEGIGGEDGEVAHAQAQVQAHMYKRFSSLQGQLQADVGYLAQFEGQLAALLPALDPVATQQARQELVRALAAHTRAAMAAQSLHLLPLRVPATAAGAGAAQGTTSGARQHLQQQQLAGQLLHSASAEPYRELLSAASAVRQAAFGSDRSRGRSSRALVPTPAEAEAEASSAWHQAQLKELLARSEALQVALREAAAQQKPLGAEDQLIPTTPSRSEGPSAAAAADVGGGGRQRVPGFVETRAEKGVAHAVVNGKVDGVLLQTEGQEGEQAKGSSTLNGSPGRGASLRVDEPLTGDDDAGAEEEDAAEEEEERCRRSLAGVQGVRDEMLHVVLPEVITALLSHDPAVFDTFAALGALSRKISRALLGEVEGDNGAASGAAAAAATEAPSPGAAQQQQQQLQVAAAVAEAAATFAELARVDQGSAPMSGGRVILAACVHLLTPLGALDRQLAPPEAFSLYQPPSPSLKQGEEGPGGVEAPRGRTGAEAGAAAIENMEEEEEQWVRESLEETRRLRTMRRVWAASATATAGGLAAEQWFCAWVVVLLDTFVATCVRHIIIPSPGSAPPSASSAARSGGAVAAATAAVRTLQAGLDTYLRCRIAPAVEAALAKRLLRASRGPHGRLLEGPGGSAAADGAVGAGGGDSARARGPSGDAAGTSSHRGDVVPGLFPARRVGGASGLLEGEGSGGGGGDGDQLTRLLRASSTEVFELRNAEALAQALQERIQGLHESRRRAASELAQLLWLHQPILQRRVPPPQWPALLLELEALLGAPSPSAQAPHSSSEMQGQGQGQVLGLLHNDGSGGGLGGGAGGSGLRWWYRDDVVGGMAVALESLREAEAGLLELEGKGGHLAEEQLRLAVGWAYSPTGGGGKGQPHPVPALLEAQLQRRQVALASARERASAVASFCQMVLSLEHSRLPSSSASSQQPSVPGRNAPSSSGGSRIPSRGQQEAYLAALTRLQAPLTASAGAGAAQERVEQAAQGVAATSSAFASAARALAQCSEEERAAQAAWSLVVLQAATAVKQLQDIHPRLPAHALLQAASLCEQVAAAAEGDEAAGEAGKQQLLDGADRAAGTIARVLFLLRDAFPQLAALQKVLREPPGGADDRSRSSTEEVQRKARDALSGVALLGTPDVTAAVSRSFGDLVRMISAHASGTGTAASSHAQTAAPGSAGRREASQSHQKEDLPAAGSMEQFQGAQGGGGGGGAEAEVELAEDDAALFSAARDRGGRNDPLDDADWTGGAHSGSRMGAGLQSSPPDFHEQFALMALEEGNPALEAGQGRIGDEDNDGVAFLSQRSPPLQVPPAAAAAAAAAAAMVLGMGPSDSAMMPGVVGDEDRGTADSSMLTLGLLASHRSAPVGPSLVAASDLGARGEPQASRGAAAPGGSAGMSREINEIMDDDESTAQAVPLQRLVDFGAAAQPGVAGGRTDNHHGGSSRQEEEDHAAGAAARQALAAGRAYARRVVARVASKLEGTDFGSSRPLEVKEQVRCLIEQACSLDNLAHMYEGWTAWI